MHGLVQKGPIMGNIKYKLAFLSQPVFSGAKAKLPTCLPKIDEKAIEAIQTCLPLLLYTPQ